MMDTKTFKQLFAKAGPVGRLEMNRERIAERLKKAVAEVDRLVDERRVMLLSPDATDEALDRCAKAVREAMSARAELEDAALAIATGLEDAYAARARETEKGERLRLAKETTERATRVEAACIAIDAAAKAFADAWSKLETTLAVDGLLPSDLPGALPINGLSDPVYRLAGFVRVSNDARELARMYGHPYYVGAVEAGIVLQIAPLRQAAKEIAAGTLPAIRPTLPPPPPLPNMRVETTTAVLRQSIIWRDENGGIATASSGESAAPEPVMASAIAAGIGLPPGSLEATGVLRAQAAIVTARQRREHEIKEAREKGKTPPEPIVEVVQTPFDTGVDLRVWTEVERERLMQLRAAA